MTAFDENKELHKRAFFQARRTNEIMTGILYGIGYFVLIFLIIMTGYIIINGFRDFYPELLTASDDGILNQLWNTIYLVFWSLLISVPLGIGAGVYLAEYAKPGKFLDFLQISIQALSSLPSIIIGLFGYLVFILMTGMRWNLMAGALVVSIMALPLITTETDQAIRSLPRGYSEGSLALGATHAQTIRKVLIPAAMPQILTGVIMAAGRGFGEAAALLYTAGQSTNISWTNWNLTSSRCPLNPFRPGETLALHIWSMRTIGTVNPHSTEIASFCSAILVIMTFVFSLITRRISDNLVKKNTGGK